MARNLKNAALLAAGLLAAAGQAHAGVADALDVYVEPIAPTVTYSGIFEVQKRRNVTATSELKSYVAYRIDIDNIAANTVNNVVFTATTSVLKGLVPELTGLLATYAYAESISGTVTCSPTTSDLTSVSCSVGQLRSSGGTTFWLYFLAPKNENGADPANPTEYVSLATETFYSEGGNDSSGSQPNDSSGPIPADKVDLGTPNPALVISALPSDRPVTLFTGNGLFAEPQIGASPPLQTSVTVPAGASVPTETIDPTAEIAQTLEGAAGTGSCNNFYSCYSSSLTIPTVMTGSVAPGGKFLTIVLRIDATNILKGTKISSVIPEYTDDLGSTYPVLKCEVDTSLGEYKALPCWTSRVAIKNAQDPNEDGDFVWEVIHNENGRYAFF